MNAGHPGVSLVEALECVAAELRKTCSGAETSALGAAIERAQFLASVHFSASDAHQIASVLVAVAQSGSTAQAAEATPRQRLLKIEDLASTLHDQLERLVGFGPTRVDLICSLMREFGYRRYLEIGCCGDACFSRIDAPVKVGVDPVSGGTHRMTSDEFFASNHERFDLIFIDGLHEATQVARDVTHALKVLNPTGVIIMHDCNPRYEVRQIVPPMTGVWNGDVWKAFVAMRCRPDLDCCIADFDYGCGIICPRPSGDCIVLERPFEELRWDDFMTHGARWLRRRSLEQALTWVRSASVA